MTERDHYHGRPIRLHDMSKADRDDPTFGDEGRTKKGRLLYHKANVEAALSLYKEAHGLEGDDSNDGDSGDDGPSARPENTFTPIPEMNPNVFFVKTMGLPASEIQALARSHVTTIISNFEGSQAGAKKSMRDLRGFGNSLDVWAKYFNTDAETHAKHAESRNLMHDRLHEEDRDAMYEWHQSLKERIFGDTDNGTEPDPSVGSTNTQKPGFGDQTTVS